MTPVPASAPLSPLLALPDDALWSSRTWTDFARLTPAARRRTVAVLPVFGFADWGLGRPLDLEESLGVAVLRGALVATKSPPLILPPLRWALGPYPHSLFPLDFETAYELVGAIARGVQAAGVTKLVFLNTSPWNEELLATVGVDLRAATGLQCYQVNLAGLGLDLHPVRAGSRVDVQSAACACCGSLPFATGVQADIALADFRPGEIRQPGPGRFDLDLATATRRGARLLGLASRRLASLWREIAAHRPGPRPTTTRTSRRKAPRRQGGRR